MSTKPLSAKKIATASSPSPKIWNGVRANHGSLENGNIVAICQTTTLRAASPRSESSDAILPLAIDIEGLFIA
jgi:hypothetical protein